MMLARVYFARFGDLAYWQLPSSRTTFKEYCLRNLGKGVIDINVSDDQAEDRIDEALQYFAQYHYDGVERMYLKHEITQADVDGSKTSDTTTATDVRDGFGYCIVH